MLKLHNKIEALRSQVGSSPIQRFYPTISFGEDRAPKVENERLIKQYFAIWGVRDSYGTSPIKGAFKKSITERGPKSNASSKIIVLWQHDSRDPLCVPNVIKEDDIGLYAEYEPDNIPSGDRCVTQVRSGTINQGSYGFRYVWDKMEYDEETDTVYMKECDLYELSPVTFGSCEETYVKRSDGGTMVDEFLSEETEDFIKRAVPRKDQLELRNIIDRHIALAKVQPLENRQKALNEIKPKHEGLDYNYLISKLKKHD